MSVFAHSRAVFVPHIFVWGSCFWFCIPPSASSRRRLLLTHNLSTHSLLTHNTHTHNLLTHNLSTHNLLTHNLLTHNLSTHNLLTHNLHTHNLLTHNLSTRNLLTHTTCPHTTCPHTTYSHTTCSHTTCPHTTCRHTTCSHTTCPHTTYSHTTCSHTTAWQAWHLGTCSSTLRGRRGTLRHPPSFHLAGVVLGHIDFHFAWQAWHVWHRAGSGGALGSQVSPWALRLFAWQAWHLHFAWQAWHAETSTFVSRGRCGIWTHRLPLCVAGVYGSGLALVARLVLRCRRGRRGFLRGRNLYMTHPLL